MLIVIEKIIREHHQLESFPESNSVGGNVDKFLSELASKGEECSKLEIVFDRQQWLQTAKLYAGDYLEGTSGIASKSKQ